MNQSYYAHMLARFLNETEEAGYKVDLDPGNWSVILVEDWKVQGPRFDGDVWMAVGP